MKNKKIIVGSFLFICLASFLTAHGAKDIDEKSVDNLQSWQESFDLTGKKAGKYNIMVTATDLGGNVYVEGPYNLYVDPKSDLPVCGITNPTPGMRVVGNLNIVGTCVDDDGVEYVDLVFDGDDEHPIRARGKEFWSYYLNTTELEEGLHTIKVIGCDINGLVGEPTTLTWNLDRRQPVTEIDNQTMGVLVSKTVKFHGTVADGNGIEKLSYSLDHGQTFSEVKLQRKKTGIEFDIAVDTRKFEDGPAVVWFKARDNAGSEGIYSFLYFIDNTSPEVAILNPTDKTPQYGTVAIAGLAKDTMGLSSLTWTFGKESGEFEIIPGNPYWAKEFDLAGTTDKSRKFSVTAKDNAGNVITVNQTVYINEALDKPKVTIAWPSSTSLIDSSEPLFVRGLATDEDGIASVKIKLDGGEWIEQETKGVFYAVLAEPNSLSGGKHTVTVVATDRHGVESTPVSCDFSARGAIPSFSEAKVGGQPFVNGMSVHPEAGQTFNTTISSGSGLATVHVETRWGNNQVKQNDYDLNGASSYAVNIPINDDLPKGIARIFITATDTEGRTREYKALLDIVNTSVVTAAEPAVVFTDSRVAEDGTIINNREFPATGYFIGGNARSAEIVPRTSFATARLDGNKISLVPGEATGTSEEVVVRVVTDQGLTYESRKLKFKNDPAFPTVTISNVPESLMIDGSSSQVTVSGSASCGSGIGALYYKVYTSRATILNGVVTGMEAVSAGEQKALTAGRTFSFDVDTSSYGIYFVEVTAESIGGNKGSSVVVIQNLPAFPEGGKGGPKAPMFVWANGADVYWAAAYQGELEQNWGVYPRAKMNAGQNALTAQVMLGEKAVTSKYTATKQVEIEANFARAGESAYSSGMFVPVAKGTSATLTAYVDTEAPAVTATYEITGTQTPGGADKSNGNAKVTKSLEKENRYVVEIPLDNLPVRMNNVKLNIKAGDTTKTISGTVGVVRPIDSSMIDDNRAVYEIEDSESKYDRDSLSYIMKPGEKFSFYANTPELNQADLLTASDGLEVAREGNLVHVTPTRDGTFSNVGVRVRDVNGASYSSSTVRFIVDSGAPEVHISTPELHQWVQNSVRITGTAADPSGVKNAEYSLDGGETWNPLNLATTGRNATGATFNSVVDLESVSEGLVGIDVRVFDVAGNVAYEHTAIQKDVTPPDVTVVVPNDDAVVNGDNLIGFLVLDNGSFEKAFYIAPPGTRGERRREVEHTTNFVTTHVGTAEKPIDDGMAFEFRDAAGNVTTVEAWKFLIDRESDLPIAEIHLPTYEDVITRDFTISGVVYDDDGPCSIFYRIDNGQYTKLEEPGTSFAIDIPFSTMTDNEHTINVYAVDINGVQGPVAERKFRVSTEEPKGAVETPTIDTANKGVVTLTGVASDKNGIEKVYVSLDNGNSYNDAVGTESWSYSFDSRAIPNGTNVVFLKVVDKYGIQGLYSSLINIDNEAPEMILDYPLDYSSTSGPLFFSGYAFDNVNITELYISIRGLEGQTVPRNQQRIDFKLDRIIAQGIDMSALANGSYNIELTALDKAQNATHISRNIRLDKNKPLATVNLLYPLNGEHKQGNFNIYGSTEADKPIERLTLYIDDKYVADTHLTESGYFKFALTPTEIQDGNHTYRVDAQVEGGNIIRSRVQTVEYSSVGPWVTIDNFVYGDFAVDRPYIEGHTNYSLDEEERAIASMKKATKEQKAAIAQKVPSKVEISFDNGKTFTQVSKGQKWHYRIENQDIAEGYHFMLVRSTMRNGETAIERCIIQIDKTAPTIRLISPGAGGRYNQEMVFSGLSSDEVGLKDVTLALRKGDKASYDVPSFIQGLYVDWHFWGATLFDIGVGLTFFDDVVKVQFQWGQFTQEQRDIFSKTDLRYGGDNVMGIKILANVASIPFSYFFGRDWEWLSANVAIGAQFSRFNESGSGEAQILSALLAQLEFPKIHFSKMKMFSTFSLYTEFALWFIPTDVTNDGDESIQNLVPQIGEGIRISIF